VAGLSRSRSLDIRLRWPRALLAAFSWLKALVDGIDLAAPECVTDAWSCACVCLKSVEAAHSAIMLADDLDSHARASHARCSLPPADHLYVQVILIGLAVLFGLAFAIHTVARVGQRAISIYGRGAPVDAPACFGRCLPGDRRAPRLWNLRETIRLWFYGDEVEPAEPNSRAFALLEWLWHQENGMKLFAVFGVNVSYVYVTGVLLQARVLAMAAGASLVGLCATCAPSPF
jgi:hypothetical protein